MLVILSPAKVLNFNSKVDIDIKSDPQFLSESSLLIDILNKYSAEELQKLMNVNSKIALDNYNRFQIWDSIIAEKKRKQALFSFDGEVFRGINAKSYSTEDCKFAQENLIILSGLYGVLRPCDMIMPYRLEMGQKLETERGKSLYAFWGTNINEYINRKLESSKDDTIINLASNEYLKSIKPAKINGNIINIVFKQYVGTELKTIVIYTKKARGLMTSFIIKNKLQNPEDIKSFSEENYLFAPELSNKTDWVFIR